jgi:hypothetical protein
MLDRFKRGPIPADQGHDVFTSLEALDVDNHDPTEDEDQTSLISRFPVDPKLVLAHEKETAE